MSQWSSRQPAPPQPTPPQPTPPQPQPQPRRFGGRPVEALPADRRRAALSARDESTARRLRYPSRARGPADAAAARRAAYEENRAAAERNRARRTRRTRTEPGICRKRARSRVRRRRAATTTPTTPPPAPATPSRDGRSAAPAVAIADDEEARARRRAFGKGARRRSATDAARWRMSLAAAGLTWASPRRARLLIDPGTGGTARSARTRRPRRRRARPRGQRGGRGGGEEAEKARCDRLSTEDFRVRGLAAFWSGPRRHSRARDVAQTTNASSSSSDESETDAMDLEESSNSRQVLPRRANRAITRRRRGGVAGKAAALRAHLRERLGEGKFDAAYRALANSTNATTKIRWSGDCAR